MPVLQAFKTYSGARKIAGDGPVIRVGNLFLAAEVSDPVGLGLTSVDLIGPKGQITGSVTMRHLERLGNANHAVAKPGYGYTGGEKFFPAEVFK